MYFISRLIVLIAFALLVVPLSFAQENLILDGGFEGFPHTFWGDWKDCGPGVRDFDNTEKVHSGNQSYKVTITEAAHRWNSDIALQGDITEVQTGDELEASAYLLIPQDNPLFEYVETYLEIIFYDGKGENPENEAGKLQSKKYGCGKPQSRWTKLTISGIVPLGTKSCKLQLVVLPLPYLDDSQEADEIYSGTVYFDDVSLINKK